ncbi:MAG: hypothetical protein B6226_02930 [Candidatus Cloacimonetes bacterium 4572_65]|nr:MAG: hypothetical protein B6226_02930 [Candidatus Cloacimonetes bacterium 4572_65]
MRIAEFGKVHQIANRNRRVALAVVEQLDGTPNVITLEWFMKTSIEPPMFAISIGENRYSYEALQQNRYFNLVIPSAKMREFTIFCGSKSGRDVNKLTENNISTNPGRYRKLPIIKNAIANFECEVVSQIKTGDHTVFIGKVKYSWGNDNVELEILSL